MRRLLAALLLAAGPALADGAGPLPGELVTRIGQVAALPADARKVPGHAGAWRRAEAQQRVVDRIEALEARGDKPCRAVKVVDTVQAAPDLIETRPQRVHHALERWTVQACGTTRVYDVWYRFERGASRLVVADSDATEFQAVLDPPYRRLRELAAARQAAALGLDASQPWGLLTPVHLHVGTEQVSLTPPAALQLDEAVSRAVLDAVRDLFESEGFTLHWAAPLQWLATHPLFDGLATASLDLDAVKSVTRRLGGTVNDVLLAVIGGAVRSYLEANGDVPASSLVAVVPVSTREDLVTTGANQVSAMFASLATDVDDPIERYHRISSAAVTAKRQAASLRPALLDDWGRMSPGRLLAVGMRAYESLRLADLHPVVYNLIISNVPGPRTPLYFLGARITHIHPFGPLLHGAGLSVTGVSIDGRIDLGVISCEHLVPDPDVVARGIESAFAELVELSGH